MLSQVFKLQRDGLPTETPLAKVKRPEVESNLTSTQLLHWQVCCGGLAAREEVQNHD